RIVESRAGLEAEQDVVRLGVMAVDVVEVVGRGQTEAELLAEIDERRVDDVLLVDPVLLHLEEEAVLAEDVAVVGDRLPSAVEVVLRDAPRDLALQAA